MKTKYQIYRTAILGAALLLLIGVAVLGLFQIDPPIVEASALQAEELPCSSTA